MLSRLPLNNLNTFAAAAEQLSFQSAAETLCVTPSAVSHQVRNLEKLLGYKLFERLDKGVRLTPQGARLFADIRDPLRQLHEASRRAVRGLADNTLTLSSVPIMATAWLLPRLKDFHAAYPHINLSVIAATDLVDFNVDPFDAALRRGSGKWPETKIYRLFDEDIVAVCHPSLLEAHGGEMSPEQVIQLPRIQNTTMATVWDDWGRSAGVDMTNAAPFSLHVQNSAQTIEALQTGETVGLVDLKFIDTHMRAGQLSIACEHQFTGDNGYFLVVPPGNDDLLSFQCFKTWLESQLAQDNGAG